MGFFDNPITNPFYRTEEDDRSDKLVGDEKVELATRVPRDKDNQAEHGRADGAEITSVAPSVECHTTAEYPPGLQRAEAIAITWNKPAIVMAYASIYLMFFLISLQAQVSFPLNPYIYSSFSLHALVPLSGVMSQIIGGVLKLPTAKLVNLWGRVEVFLVMVGFMVLGMVLMATTKHIETYVAGQVFYWLGNDGAQYVLDVMISDTSTLGNRAIMLAFSTTPYIATTFAGPVIAQKFIDSDQIPWGYGVFCIIIPLAAAPVATIFLMYQRKAKQAGLCTRETSNRTFWEFVKYYLVEFDVGGLFIGMVGLITLLIPFQVSSTMKGTFHNPAMITLIIIGSALCLFFPFYEARMTPKTFVPWHLLKERTLLGSSIAIASLWAAFYCWDPYFSSFLQVVYGLDVRDAGYVSNIYSIASPFVGVVVGAVVRYQGRFKWLGLAAVPIYMLGSGLMIRFRQPDEKLGYLIMAQLLVGIGGGVVVILEQVAAVASVAHSDIAFALAIVSLAAQIGGAFGGAIAAGIWTNTFEVKLAEYLPAGAGLDAAAIADSLPLQLSYPIGTPARDAIVAAYGYGFERMCIASTSWMIFTLVGVWMWRDIKMNNKKQVKGNVVE